jgi:hypothetical protein
VTCYTESFSHFVTSMTASVASGWSGAGWGLHPLESDAFSQRTQRAVIHRAALPACLACRFFKLRPIIRPKNDEGHFSKPTRATLNDVIEFCFVGADAGRGLNG